MSLKPPRVGEPTPPVTGPPYLVGWKEYVDFPEWGVSHVKTKIDTGARTSAVHVAHYDIRESDGDGRIVELHLSLDRRRPEVLTVVRTPLVRMIAVKSSGGYREARPVVSTHVRLGPVTKPVLLTVTNRANMLFRVLLGRKALENDFVVDVSRKYRMKKREV